VGKHFTRHLSGFEGGLIPALGIASRPCSDQTPVMVSISIEYTGDFHCNAVHGPSGAKLETDAPTDNQGKGEAFSPTDLVATALGTCIATTMAIVGERNGIDLRGMTVQVSKEMADAPRRISRLTTEVHIPLPADHAHRELLEKTALGCPVHRSLEAGMERPTKFFWEG
jgi:putative redox protein